MIQHTIDVFDVRLVAIPTLGKMRLQRAVKLTKTATKSFFDKVFHRIRKKHPHENIPVENRIRGYQCLVNLIIIRSKELIKTVTFKIMNFQRSVELNGAHFVENTSAACRVARPRSCGFTRNAQLGRIY
jgi:hypothetical protein